MGGLWASLTNKRASGQQAMVIYIYSDRGRSLPVAVTRELVRHQLKNTHIRHAKYTAAVHTVEPPMEHKPPQASQSRIPSRWPGQARTNWAA